MSTEFERKVIEDFNLAALSGPDQTTIIRKVEVLLCKAVLLRSCDALTDTQMDAFDSYVGGLGPDDKDTPALVYGYLARNVPEFHKLVKEEYDKLVDRIKLLSKSADARAAKIRGKADVEELIESGLGFTSETLSEVPAFDSNLLSVAALIVQLVADPSSALRTKKEKLKRINKICSKAIFDSVVGISVAYFIAVLFYTLARLSQEAGLISGIPDIISLPVPGWFEALTLPGQAVALLALLALISVVLICSGLALQLAAARGFFNFLYREKKIRPADRVTEIFRGHASFAKLEPYVGSDETFLRICRIIYNGVFNDGARRRFQTRENAEILDTLLLSVGVDEDAVVRFLKPKVPNYRRAVNREIERFTEDALSLMIAVDSPAGVRPR